MKLQPLTLRSSFDGVDQSCLVHVPDGAARPALVCLHQWSSGFDADNTAWAECAAARGWVYIQPDFRGPNVRPEACGSEAAQHDVLDAARWAVDHADADPRRVYLAGTSGGGHMAMLMAARWPRAFAAVSAWVGISDLAAWHSETGRVDRYTRYAANIERCVGGPPGSASAVDEQVRLRSSIHHLAAARDLPLDLCAGVTDGHTGSVPIHHTIDAFNVVALAVTGKPAVSDDEIAQLSQRQRLDRPTADDTPDDTTFAGRAILLRRSVGKARLTIFDGGHEGLPGPACAFLERHTAP